MMTTVGKFATPPESRLGKQMVANDDSAANEEEVEEQIEEDNVRKAAHENSTGATIPFMSKQIETADDAVASNDEAEEQVERKRVEKEAFENRISAASAEKWRNGRIRG
ncbi:MAG: hypothetical protein WA491_13665 [Candidatus Acidiferrum sp.]|jgi:hypothetical protein